MRTSIDKVQDAKVCLTAAGILIHRGKVLLIKHKKLGIWLAPGGHLELHEQPHQAAEREFVEETGVVVSAVAHQDAPSLPATDPSRYVPNPILSNLHWISRTAYQRRKELKRPLSQAKHCEIHHVQLYLMEPVGSLEYRQNIVETDGIAWVAPEEIDDLETLDNIKQELRYVFKLV